MKFLFVLLICFKTIACTIQSNSDTAIYKIHLQGERKLLDENCSFINQRISQIIEKLSIVENIQAQRQELFKNELDILSIQVQRVRAHKLISGQISVNLFKADADSL